MKTLKIVTRIEMSGNDVVEVLTSGTVEIHRDLIEEKYTRDVFPDRTGAPHRYYTIHSQPTGEVFDENLRGIKYANEYLLFHAIDDDLIIRGYGPHSGRKFWQLPDKIQAKIKKFITV